MRVYLDTNVLVAYFKPNDPYYLDSRAILNCSRINKVVSFLTLAEFSSAISRLEKGGQVEFAPEIRAIISKIPPREKAIILSKYIVKKFNLEVLGAKEPVNLKIGDKPVLFPLEFLKIINLSCELGLKTLDNLHIAVVALENKIAEIKYFVTGDNDIIDHRERTLSVTGCPALTPKEFVKLMGLRD